MQNLLSILFYIKRSKVDKLGRVNIYMRITVNGKRAELSVNRKVDVSKWNSSGNNVRGMSAEAREINRYLNVIKNKVYKLHSQLVDDGEFISAEVLRDAYLGKDKHQKMILKVFEDHNIQMKNLVGKDFSPRTLQRYVTTRNHLKAFIELEYHKKDLSVRKIDLAFINGFIYYLKTERNCTHNSALKYIAYFKKIVRIAYANSWIDKDPFFNFKVKRKVVEREFLTTNEIQLMLEKEFTIPRLEHVRDVFIFCCFTGLAYADVLKLSENDIIIGIDGKKWIKAKRLKTDTLSSIPLLPIAKEILDKYKDQNHLKKDSGLLPVYTNQRMNSYLKEIADVCGIQKKMTFHLARHTFATTVTLSNGVPIESVSKMLGHRSLKTTQHYAKTLDRKLSEDMNSLKDRLLSEDFLKVNGK